MKSELKLGNDRVVASWKYWVVVAPGRAKWDEASEF